MAKNKTKATAKKQAKATPKTNAPSRKTPPKKASVKPAPAKPAPAKPAPAKPAPSSSKPRHGLGRGLGALIGEIAAPAAQVSRPAPVAAQPQAPSRDDAAAMVKTSLIERSPWQPRVTFDPESLRELADSIRSHGVIQPLVCRKLPADKGGGYQLIAGERRLRAAIEAGLDEVPVVISNVDDRDAAEMSIIENIQRDDLNVIEEAEGYKTLADEFGLTQQEVADRVGKSRPGVANALRLLELPDEVKVLLSNGLLSAGHAKVLLGLDSENDQTLLARRCVEEQLTVRTLENIIERRARERAEPDSRKKDIPESHVRYLLDRLHAKFGAPVRLSPSATLGNGRRAKGTLEIDFADNDDLTRLLGIFGIDVD